MPEERGQWMQFDDQSISEDQAEEEAKKWCEM